MKLVDILPDADVVVALEPDELGLDILRVLAKWPTRQDLTLALFLQVVQGNAQLPGQYPPARGAEIAQAIREAWAWLEGAALLIEHPRYYAPNDHRILSRRAERLAQEQDPRCAFTARRLAKDALHEAIREDVWALYHRGRYDTAVFEAMKAVEVAVREAARLGASDLGVDLMRKAFQAETGPLTDTSVHPSEQLARRDLFASAIGSYKNPHSHRYVALEDPDEAAEIIMLANHLLRIVDTRREVLGR